MAEQFQAWKAEKQSTPEGAESLKFSAEDLHAKLDELKILEDHTAEQLQRYGEEDPETYEELCAMVVYMLENADESEPLRSALEGVDLTLSEAEPSADDTIGMDDLDEVTRGIIDGMSSYEGISDKPVDQIAQSIKAVLENGEAKNIIFVDQNKNAYVIALSLDGNVLNVQANCLDTDSEGLEFEASVVEKAWGMVSEALASEGLGLEMGEVVAAGDVGKETAINVTRLQHNFDPDLEALDMSEYGVADALKWDGKRKSIANSVKTLAMGPERGHITLVKQGSTGIYAIHITRDRGELYVVVENVDPGEGSPEDEIRAMAEQAETAMNNHFKPRNNPEVLAQAGYEDGAGAELTVHSKYNVDGLVHVIETGGNDEVHPDVLAAERAAAEGARDAALAQHEEMVMTQRMTAQISEHDFWRSSDIIPWASSTEEGVEGVTRIPVGDQYIDLLHYGEGEYAIQDAENDIRLGYTSLDDALYDLSNLQKCLSEVAVGRSQSGRDEPFVLKMNGDISFASWYGAGALEDAWDGASWMAQIGLGGAAGAAGLFASPITGLAGGAALGLAGGPFAPITAPIGVGVGTIGAPISGMVGGYALGGEVRGRVDHLFYGDNRNFKRHPEALTKMANAYFRKMREARKANALERAPKNDREKQLYKIIDQSHLWNKEQVRAVTDNRGFLRIDIPVNGTTLELSGTGINEGWKLEAGGKTMEFPNLYKAMYAVGLIENLANEVASGKYEVHELGTAQSSGGWIDEGFDVFAGDLTFNGLSMASAEIKAQNAGVTHVLWDEDLEKIAAILNGLYGDVRQWDSQPLPFREVAASEVEIEGTNPEDDGSVRGGGAGGGQAAPGGDPEPSGAAASTPPAQSTETGAGGEPEDDGAKDSEATDEEGSDEDAARQIDNEFAEKEKAIQSRYAKTEEEIAADREKADALRKKRREEAGEVDVEGDESADSDRSVDRAPSDDERMETHESLTVLNGMAQLAFGKNKDFRARIMRRLRKRKRGKEEGRDGRTRFPVIRITNLEVKDGHVSVSFADSINDSGSVITYEASAPRPEQDPAGAEKNQMGFVDTPSNRAAMRALFKGSVFRFRDTASHSREHDVGTEAQAERALDQRVERKDMRKKWRGLRKDIRSYVNTDKKMNVSFGSRAPKIINKDIRISYKGKRERLDLVLDYDPYDDEVTVKVYDKNGKIYSDWEEAVDDAKARLKKGRIRKL